MTQTIRPFTPLGEVEAQERLRQFIEHYRPLALLLPNVANFEENSWDLRGLYFQAVQGNSKLGVCFTKQVAGRKERERGPLDQPFLTFTKAYVLHLIGTNNWSTHSPLASFWLPVLRCVEHELIVARQTEPPCITALTEDVCEAINASIRNGAWNAATKYQLCLILNQLVVNLQDLGLCIRRFTWKGVIPRHVDNRQKVGPEGDKARVNMLPTPEAMSAMAYCFARAESPREKWVSAINGLLSPRPARLGECWFLRENYFVDLEVQGQKRFGLRWWPQKHAKPLIKEFLANDPFVPVIRQAFDWLIEISAPARALAKWYEDNPGRIFLPPNLENLRGKAILTVAEAAAIRNVAAKGFLHSNNWARRRGLVPVIDPGTGEMGIRFKDLERAALSDLPNGFPWFNRGKNLKYSDMIILTREGEFHPNCTTSSIMFALPNVATYYRALDVMVDRHELAEKDGSAVRIRSHQFRHKLETVAFSNGVARSWMNREAGRAHISQEESYDDRTDAERVAQTRIVSVQRSVYGEVMAFEPKRPMTYEETLAGIEAAKRTGYAHITDKGCCIHNFVDKACTEFRDCLFCEDHICIKGIPEWDRNILAACDAEEANFLHATEAAEQGRYGVREHIEGLLLPRVVYCRQVKSLINNPAVPKFSVFKHAPRQDPYDPVVNGIRLHVECGRKEGRDRAWLDRLEHALEKLQSIRKHHPEILFLFGGSDE